VLAGKELDAKDWNKTVDVQYSSLYILEHCIARAQICVSGNYSDISLIRATAYSEHDLE